MNVRDIIPESLISYVRLLEAKWGHPQATIWSDRIDRSAFIGTGCLICAGVQIGCGVRIGDYSYVNLRTIIASGSVGKFCSIGYSCQIGMPEHPVEFASASPRTYGRRNVFQSPCTWNDYSHPPRIGNDVWIGSAAIVLQDVEIGDGAIVAAGAIVNKSIPPYTISAGVPARVIRDRFDCERTDALARLRWWDLPMNELQAYARLFGTRDWTADDCAKYRGDEGNL